MHVQSIFFLKIYFCIGDPDCAFLLGYGLWRDEKKNPVIKDYWAFMDLPYKWLRILGLVNNFELLFSGYPE